MVGQTLAHYRLEEQLGAGGMGVVYKATDTTLGRTVAIKLLHEDVAHDSDRASRLEREARLLASLNHPNIAAIHGIERSGGLMFLVLEYVPGATLDARLAQGRIPLREALSIGVQIAEALETAHERGIIHRDLKPANIKVTGEGKVKILDFGLAKALDNGATMNPADTTTREATVAGAILGTAPYMSPEQACGKPLDARTDIWSFGCVLYETLTGIRTFSGDTAAEVLAGIVEREPDWAAVERAQVPPGVERLLRRCLQKDPRSRLRSIGDARIELEETLAGKAPVPSSAPAATRRRARLVAAAVLAGLLLGVPGGAWIWSGRSAPVPRPVVRFSIDLPPGQAFRPTWNPQLALAPDGRTLAFSHRFGSFATTFLRRLDDLAAKPLNDSPGMAIPAFSPDGRYLVVIDPFRQTIRRTSLSGGAPVDLAPADMVFRGDWGSDNYYYWTTHYFGPIVRIPTSGGNLEPVTELDLEKQERTHRHAQLLPGGKAIIFTVSVGGIESFDDARIDAFTLDTRKRKVLVQGGFGARYAASGHLVYARGGALYAVPFDANRLEVTGTPVKVVDGVFMSTNSGAAHFDISRTGTLAYLAGKAEGGERTLVWVDRHGASTPLPLPPRSYAFPRIAPDGRRIAFEVEGVNHDLYLYEPDRDVTSRITADGVSHAPVWTPDGKRIAFRSWKAGTMTMWWMPADRSGPAERLTMVGARQSLVSFSPDGRYATFDQMEVSRSDRMQSHVWTLPLQGDRTPRPFLRSEFTEGSARFSPDGKWVAYCTTEPGRNEVYVQPWPGPGPRIQVSSNGGTDPIWSRDGRELFYRNGDTMMVVRVTTSPTFRSSKPEVLWEGHYSHGMGSSCGPPGTTEANYDVSFDGQRFLMVKDVNQDASSNRIIVVLNFDEEMRKKVEEAQKR